MVSHTKVNHHQHSIDQIKGNQGVYLKAICVAMTSPCYQLAVYQTDRSEMDERHFDNSHDQIYCLLSCPGHGVYY